MEVSRDGVERTVESFIPTLEKLVRIPSIGSDPRYAGEMINCATLVRDLLAQHCDSAEILEVPGGAPWVLAEKRSSDPDAPTVLLYAHYDVQPPGSVADWSAAPFELTSRQGRLLGRGVADDKGAIIAHAATLAVLQDRDDLPVNVTVLIEGEEEQGSPNIDTFFDIHGPALHADLVIVLDSVNADRNPALTVLLRGLYNFELTVSTTHPTVHSGIHGGIVIDPFHVLSRVVGELTRSPRGLAPVDGYFTENGRRRAAGDKDDARAVQVAGPAILQSTVSVLGIDISDVNSAAHAVPHQLRALFSVRVSPWDRVSEITTVVDDALSAIMEECRDEAHLSRHDRAKNDGYFSTGVGEAMENAKQSLAVAFDAVPTLNGLGGVIPFVPKAARWLSPAPVLVTAIQDPQSNAHGPDESLDITTWKRSVYAQCLMLSSFRNS